MRGHDPHHHHLRDGGDDLRVQSGNSVRRIVWFLFMCLLIEGFR